MRRSSLHVVAASTASGCGVLAWRSVSDSIPQGRQQCIAMGCWHSRAPTPARTTEALAEELLRYFPASITVTPVTAATPATPSAMTPGPGPSTPSISMPPLATMATPVVAPVVPRSFFPPIPAVYGGGDANDVRIALLHLTRMRDHAAAGATSLSLSIETLTDRFAASVQAQPASFGWIEEGFTGGARAIVADVSLLRDDTEKVLDAAYEEWKVSGEQLAAAAALCEDAILRGDLAAMAAAATDVQTMSPLLAREYKPPRTLICPRFPSSTLLSALNGCFSVGTACEPSRCVVGGPGLTGFDSMDARASWAFNVVRVTVKDDAGAPVASLLPSDVTLLVQGGSVKDAAVPSPSRPGGVDLTYGVWPGVRDATLRVWVLGQEVPGTWVAHGGFDAKGKYVRTHTLTFGADSVGLSIAPDGRAMYVCNPTEACVSAYSLPEGERIAEFGSVRNLTNPVGVAVWPDNGNIIVADGRGRRLQEFTQEGDLSRTIGSGVMFSANLTCVSVGGQYIAVGRDADQTNNPAVYLVDYATATVTRCVGPVLVHSVRFSPDTERLLIVGSPRGNAVRVVSMYDLHGKCLGNASPEHVAGPVCADFSPHGNWVVVDGTSFRVTVLDSEGRKVVKSWGSDGNGHGQFRTPTFAAVSGRFVYVTDKETSRVQVFE